MKRIIFGSLAVVIGLAAVAGYSSAQSAASHVEKLVPAGTLSDEDVAALKQKYTDTKLKKSWQWSGDFSQVKLSAKDAKKAKTLKKIPYRLTAALYEVIDVQGKKSYKRGSGTCWFFLKDAEGKVVYKRSQSLSKMCPS
jgi:hypothetical protein